MKRHSIRKRGFCLPRVSSMLSANFEAQFFRQPFADFWWKAIMHVTGSHQGRIDHGHRGRCRHRYYQPHECRKSEACERPSSSQKV